MNILETHKTLTYIVQKQNKKKLNGSEDILSFYCLKQARKYCKFLKSWHKNHNYRIIKIVVIHQKTLIGDNYVQK